MVNLYQKIDVLFAPSLWPESYGLVTREAAASGCWVVASSLGGIGEGIIHGVNGFRIHPSIKEVSNIIEYVDENKSQFKGNVREVSPFLVDEQVKELVSKYYE